MTVAEHEFAPPLGQPWERCAICHLSEAQHFTTLAKYEPEASYRCPYCVNTGAETCTHREAPLGMDAKPLERESA